ALLTEAACDLTLAIDEDVPDAERRGHGSGLTDVGPDHQPHPPARGSLVRKRRRAQRHARNRKWRRERFAQVLFSGSTLTRGGGEDECLPRTDDRAPTTDVHVYATTGTLAIVRLLLDAEEVVGGDLGRESIEDRLAGAGHVIE